jgi:putative endonuclease
MYYIYILYSVQADKFYVGHTHQPAERLNQHRNNPKEKFTGRYTDWSMKALFEVSDHKGDADRIEKWIKRQKSRKLIEALISTDTTLYGELAQLVRVPCIRD